MKPWLRKILITLFILYLSLTTAAFFTQRKFIYFPPDNYGAPPDSFKEVVTETGILGWYSPAQNSRATVMIFHGNASAIDSNMHIFRDLQAAGYGVWSVGYPGFPGNTWTRHLIPCLIWSDGMRNFCRQVYYYKIHGSHTAP